MSFKEKVMILGLIMGVLVGCGSATKPTVPATDEPFNFGVILVGPHDDHGWSEAHYNGGLYVESKIANSRMIYSANLNPDTRPEATFEKTVDEMVAQKVRLIFVTSEDFSVDTASAAKKYPQVVFAFVSSEHVLKENMPSNFGSYIGRMDYGEMMAGCTAALATQTGKIGYLGSLVYEGTRALVNATYLGARYCYEHYRHKNPDELSFEVKWIGFWFYIPDVTGDPTKITNDFFEQKVDVVISGLDTTESLIVAGKRFSQGQQVWAIPLNYKKACEVAAQACLGVPYHNFSPIYLNVAQEVKANSWQQSWKEFGPDWSDLNNQDTSAIGFIKGSALGAEQAKQLDEFTQGLANGSIQLFKGPLYFQDGQLFLAQDEVATDDKLSLMPQLLEGIIGQSAKGAKDE